MTSQTTDRVISVVGLGKMGLPIAAHLTRAGHRVVGFDAAEPARAAAAAAGVAMRPTAAEAARDAAATLVVVGTDAQLLDACCGTDGVLAGAAGGHVVFLCSTVSPETSVAVAKRAADTGVEVLDATLCGGEAGAVEGRLLVMGGGRADTLDAWRDTFASFAADVVHLGDVGAGQVGKLVNNLLVWIAVVGNYEALRLGMRLGLDQEKLRQALLRSSGDNPLMRTWRRARPMPWAEDDMTIVMERADALALPLPLAGLVRELIKDIKVRKRAWGTDPESYESMFDFVEWVESAAQAGRPARQGEGRS
jgi:3-hydroxyisobutyrate dehydrogenase-like beta-hydroxyacid dehydrogenase